jgi:hypothetical protein
MTAAHALDWQPMRGLESDNKLDSAGLYRKVLAGTRATYCWYISRMQHGF